MQKRARPRKPDVAIIIVSLLFVPLQPEKQEIFGKMFTVILLMLAGIAAGYLQRSKRGLNLKPLDLAIVIDAALAKEGEPYHFSPSACFFTSSMDPQ